MVKSSPNGTGMPLRCTLPPPWRFNLGAPSAIPVARRLSSFTYRSTTSISSRAYEHLITITNPHTTKSQTSPSSCTSPPPSQPRAPRRQRHRHAHDRRQDPREPREARPGHERQVLHKRRLQRHLQQHGGVRNQTERVCGDAAVGAVNHVSQPQWILVCFFLGRLLWWCVLYGVTDADVVIVMKGGRLLG